MLLYLSTSFHSISLPCKLLRPFKSKNRSNMETDRSNCGEIPLVADQDIIANDKEENPWVKMMRPERPVLSDFMLKAQYIWGGGSIKEVVHTHRGPTFSSELWNLSRDLGTSFYYEYCARWWIHKPHNKYIVKYIN